MKAIIAGVTGAVGSAIARELAGDDTASHLLPGQPEATAIPPGGIAKRPHPRSPLASSGGRAIVGLSRNPPKNPVSGVEYVHADLADAGGCRQALSRHGDATHLFYCARATHREQTLEDAATNLTLLDNVLSAAERGPLRHVHLVQGGKVYGVHVGPFPSPAREDDPRAPIENFNYDQEDLLLRRSAGRPWTWSASRPNTLLHFSPDIARNLVSSLGAYAAICRELGCALDFPGPEGAYRSLTQVTSIELLARAAVWMATEPACANQAFNVTNGDVFRWSRLWPHIAGAFDMPCGSVRPLRLASVMEGREAVWDRIRVRHRLAPRLLSEVANWGYLDATLERTWDEILSTTKARSFGFHDWADSEERVLALIGEYRAAQILPVFSSPRQAPSSTMLHRGAAPATPDRLRAPDSDEVPGWR